MSAESEAVRMKMSKAEVGGGASWSKAAKSTGAYGPGGVEAALNRNPNNPQKLNAEMNDEPYGPISHGLGLTNDGGWQRYGGGAYEGGDVPAGKPGIKGFNWK